MSKIEEVARAIYEEHYVVELKLFGAMPEWADMDADDREMWVDMARAALLAIREPDEGMVDAGLEGMKGLVDTEDWLAVDADAFARGLSAAIDHALTQETSE